MRNLLFTWKVLLPCLLLAACSGYAPPDAVIGMSRDELLLRMGKPDTEFVSKEGTRLEFPRGPAGKHTWFVYLDASGRVSRSEQVLTEKNFNLINPDMTRRCANCWGGPVKCRGSHVNAAWSGTTATRTIHASGSRWNCRWSSKCVLPVMVSHLSVSFPTIVPDRLQARAARRL